MDKKKIGQFLKTLREQKGKKQYQVAMELSEYGIEISDKTVAKWEKGNFPDLDKLDIIADYFGVKASDILNGEVYMPQDFSAKYFIVNNEWMQHCSQDELYQTRVAQERLIKERVKELLIELVEKKSLTAMQNDELNFLLMHFYSVSNYAIQINIAFEDLDKREQVKLLRHEIYSIVLSMHDSSVDEIYWEIKKLFNYDKRVTFRQNVRGYEANILATKELLLSLDDWEKDLLLAQVQTQNIADFYDKLTYFRRYGIDYDEERITKEGIKLLIECGAKFNRELLGYAEHRHFYFSILERMKLLHNRINDKILVSKYNTENREIEYYWLENNAKNRLIKLYYALNCSRDEKMTLNDVYEIFQSNNSLPKQIILSRNKSIINKLNSEKEILLMAEQLCPYEIKVWNESKEKEIQLEKDKSELKILEERWSHGERIDVYEYDEWVGEEKNMLTEDDILSRLSHLTYDQFIEGRNEEMTIELVQNLDLMSLSEIRKRYFPVEVKYEGGEI